MTISASRTPTGDPYPGSAPIARISSTVAGVKPDLTGGLAQLRLIDVEIAPDHGEDEPAGIAP